MVLDSMIVYSQISTQRKTIVITDIRPSQKISHLLLHMPKKGKPQTKLQNITIK